MNKWLGHRKSIMNTGKILEAFIGQVEQILLPHDITISANEKVFNDEGIQIAEFDIEIEGKVGSTHLKWLIECRDRPAQGSAPGSWIEQLVGRRDRFNFNKVIAVSTTGFASGAITYAKEAGIEIRTVTESNLDQIKDWFLIETMSLLVKGGKLDNAKLIIDQEESVEIKKDLKEKLQTHGITEPILISTKTNEAINILVAFQSAINCVDEIYDPLIPQGGKQAINLQVSYPKDDSHYIVELKNRNVRIKQILFQGEISVTKEEVPVAAIKNYDSISDNVNIATTANFIFKANGIPLEISFNKLTDTGETHVLLHNLKNKA